MKRRTIFFCSFVFFLFTLGLKSSEKQLKLLGKFGGMDVHEQQFLNNPVDIAVSKEGEIYILDSRDNDIKVFKKEGTFIKCMGREGSGPGEFKRPWMLGLIEDKIYVADTGNRRIQVLSKNGEYLRSFRVPIDYGQGMTIDSKGNLCLNTQGLKSPKLISVYNNEGNFLKEIGNLEGESIQFYDISRIKNQIRKGEIPDNFKNDILLDFDKTGNLFAVHLALNKFKKLSPEGESICTIEIKAEEYQKIYNAFRKRNDEIADLPFAYYPLAYINDLAVDKQGSLYILLNEPSRMIIYLFSNSGEFKGRLLGVDDAIVRMAISDDNIIYAISSETHFIYKFALNIE